MPDADGNVLVPPFLYTQVRKENRLIVTHTLSPCDIPVRTTVSGTQNLFLRPALMIPAGTIPPMLAFSASSLHHV